MSSVLALMDLEPSPLSRDYIENKRQFHLSTLLTEQRHPRTWALSFTIQSDIRAGLEALLAVDRDIEERLSRLILHPQVLESVVDAVAEAIRKHRKIYIYGCGSTGRLAKQMESAFWRPFWRRVKSHTCWRKLAAHLPQDIEGKLIGEMTGADRALVSSLEGFEDLQLLGRLQLADREVNRGDVVICVTEGGETSSVIGTILAAADLYQDGNAAAGEKDPPLFFVFNNPEELLRPFRRSAAVLAHPSIVTLNLTTGPQAITGSTRMQATTIETFVIGVALEQAIADVLGPLLTPAELSGLGFGQNLQLRERLATFGGLRSAVVAALPSLAGFTRREAETYRREGFATYFSGDALITVFIDSTERSPTFRLYPLDRIQDQQRRSWVQVWTEAEDLRHAWERALGRPFRGLRDAFYRRPLEAGVTDPYLRRAALESLAHAGNDQEGAYDLSFSDFNIRERGPGPGDLGVLVLLDDELNQLEDPRSGFRKFARLFTGAGCDLVCLAVTDARLTAAVARSHFSERDLWVHVRLPEGEDPLTLRRQIALKMLLNAHSTGTMALLDRVIGNTMTSVNPSNLKLIGRATYLIQTHVNDVLDQPGWAGAQGGRLTYPEANAVLYEAMEFVRTRGIGETAEVGLSIIRILETLKRESAVGWAEAEEILATEGLARYLLRLHPSLKQPDTTSGSHTSS
jgi:N-acetylmuramic acid 6-phosphate (MurNAc-6-P) etherase